MPNTTAPDTDFDPDACPEFAAERGAVRLLLLEVRLLSLELDRLRQSQRAWEASAPQPQDGLARHIAEQLIPQWKQKARRAIFDAQHESNPMWKRLIEHGSICTFDCTEDPKEALQRSAPATSKAPSTHRRSWLRPFLSLVQKS